MTLPNYPICRAVAQWKEDGNDSVGKAESNCLMLFAALIVDYNKHIGSRIKQKILPVRIKFY